MCKNRIIIFGSCLDIWENSEWLRLIWPTSSNIHTYIPWCWCLQYYDTLHRKRQISLFVAVDAVLLHCGNTVVNIADICLWKIYRRWSSSRVVLRQVRITFDTNIHEDIFQILPCNYQYCCRLHKFASWNCPQRLMADIQLETVCMTCILSFVCFSLVSLTIIVCHLCCSFAFVCMYMTAAVPIYLKLWWCNG